jgi:hypothetical protein
MTEADWLTCVNPQPMLLFLRGKVSERKLRLFAVACCRRFAMLTVGIRGDAVGVAEDYSDGRAGERQRQSALAAARNFGMDYDYDYDSALAAAHLIGMDDDARELFDLCHTALLAVCSALETPVNAAAVASHLLRLPPPNGHPRGVEEGAQANLVREIFGNPFHRVLRDPTWLLVDDGSARALARKSYDERVWSRIQMSILGDALEDGGCADQAILAHCRSNVQHVRGCWVIDCLLDHR